MDLIPDRILGRVAVMLLSAGLLAAPLGVSAQTSAPASPQAAPSAPATPALPAAKSRRSRVSRVDAYINNLHKRLMITPAQEQQWAVVAQIMRDNAQSIDQLASQRSAKRSTMTAVENLHSYEEIADAHADELKKLVPAFEALYDSMSDAQKKNADAVFGQRRSASRKKS